MMLTGLINLHLFARIQKSAASSFPFLQILCPIVHDDHHCSHVSRVANGMQNTMKLFADATLRQLEGSYF